MSGSNVLPEKQDGRRPHPRSALETDFFSHGLTLDDPPDAAQDALPPASPMIDGLESLAARNLSLHSASDTCPGSSDTSDSSLRLRMPALGGAADMALAAMQYLPMPVLVLSELKTVVLANEAMARLLGIEAGADQDGFGGAGTSATDILKGRSLSQLGIDMLQDGR